MALATETRRAEVGAVDPENANKIAVETKVVPGNVVLSACVLLPICREEPDRGAEQE